VQRSEMLEKLTFAIVNKRKRALVCYLALSPFSYQKPRVIAGFLRNIHN
jgi:hypothetical protein